MLVDQGKKLPFTVVLCRTLHFDMSAMIMMRGGSETGMMTYGHSNVELGDDVKTKTAIVNYTGYLSATVFRPKNVIVLPDVIFNGYRGGGGTKLCETYANWISEGVKMSSGSTHASMGVMLRPVGYDVHGVVAASNYFTDSLPHFEALDATNAHGEEAAADVFRAAYRIAFDSVKRNYMGTNGDANGHVNADGVDAHGEYNSRLRHWNSVFQQVRCRPAICTRTVMHRINSLVYTACRGRNGTRSCRKWKAPRARAQRRLRRRDTSRAPRTLTRPAACGPARFP